jgi:cytochrome P450
VIRDLLAAAQVEMSTYLDAQVAERRQEPREDLLTRLVQAEVDDTRLTERELLHELARLRAAPELVPSAIEEVLRYRTPVQAMFRTTRHSIDLGGVTIPESRLVLAMIGAANRDPRHFPDPERFDISRAPNPHLAFGHGIHFCLGARLARLEGKIALTDLLARMSTFELASSAWTPRKPFHVHGPSSLPLRFTR